MLMTQNNQMPTVPGEISIGRQKKAQKSTAREKHLPEKKGFYETILGKNRKSDRSAKAVHDREDTRPPEQVPEK